MLSLNSFKDLRHVHIIGVGGTLMGAFAAFLKRQGIEVTGSDQKLYPPMSDVLKEAGVRVLEGYDPKNLTAFSQCKPDLVIIGNVIRADNPEAQLARSGDYPCTSLPEAMEKLLLPQTRNLVVSGTHGKTTTSSLLAFTLKKLNLDPSYFIGGVSLDLPNSFHVGRSKGFFVLEGDEYDTAFWDKVPKFNHYLPDEVILTSVEYDHADIYPDLASVIRAFEGLMERIRPGGSVIACLDFPHVHTVIKKSQSLILTYGLTDSAQFVPTQIKTNSDGVEFEVKRKGVSLGRVRLQLPGIHNVLNATAVIALCTERLGLEAGVVTHALSEFRGVKRRQEIRGEPRGILVIDDFAHHPTAVRETLKALKAKYPNRRMIAVFEPRSATSRRKVFQKEYGAAFNDAEHCFIALPHDQNRIASVDQFSSEELVKDLIENGKNAELLDSLVEGSAAEVPAVKQLTSFLKPNDVVAVLSNGGFAGLIPKLLKSLA